MFIVVFTRAFGAGRIVALVLWRWELALAFSLQAIALVAFGYLGAYAILSPEPLWLAGWFGFFTQGFSYILNDITDQDVDRISHPHRPLPAGRVTSRQAWGVVWGCLGGALLTGGLLATHLASYGWLVGHLACSLLYSWPRLRWGRHWLRGPLSLAGANTSWVLFLLSGTPLAERVPGGAAVVGLVGGVCLLQHLLVIPLKDLHDVAGDAAAGGSSLAIRYSSKLVVPLGMVGYVVPWLVLYAGAWYLNEHVETGLTGLVLSRLAGVLGLVGAGLAGLVRLKPQLLLRSQRFIWFAETGLLFVFQLSLPLTTLVAKLP